MSRADFFLAPIRAFYSNALYMEAAERWRGRAILYLVYLAAIVCVPVLVGAYRGIAQFVSSDGEGVIGQLPTITVSDGLVSTDAVEPYRIRSTGKEPFVIILDTTGEITSLESEEEKLLIGRDAVLFRKSARETRSYGLSGVKDFTVDQQRARGWLKAFGVFGTLLCGPVLIALFFIGQACMALFDSLFALLLAKAMNVRLGYGGIFSLTVLAMTPPALLDSALTAAKVNLPVDWLVFFAIYLAIVAIALRAWKRHEAAVTAPAAG